MSKLSCTLQEHCSTFWKDLRTWLLSCSKILAGPGAVGFSKASLRHCFHLPIFQCKVVPVLSPHSQIKHQELPAPVQSFLLARLLSAMQKGAKQSMSSVLAFDLLYVLHERFERTHLSPCRFLKL